MKHKKNKKKKKKKEKRKKRRKEKKKITLAVSIFAGRHYGRFRLVERGKHLRRRGKNHQRSARV